MRAIRVRRLGASWIAILAAACRPAIAPGETNAREVAAQARLVAARDRVDVAALRAHGWELWRELQDRWSSFEPSDVVLGRRDRVFRSFRPFRNGDAVEEETLPVMFSVRFDPTAAAHIRRYALGARARVRRMDAIPAFPRSAIAIKLVWYPVHRLGRTRVPIWDGDGARPDDRGNADRTWRRTIAIDPTRAAVPRNEIDATGAHVVALDAFVHRRLESDDEVAAARRVARDPSLTRGDHVVLLGVHVATKEIPDWVWATFWWHDRPTTGRFGADRPSSVTGAASHYLMDVAYSADTPRADDGGPNACMNPWLEARFPGGLHSNCLACHQRAAVGAGDYLPVTRGALAPDAAYFRGKTTTDFVWTLALEAR